jgi:hypothetical protein
VRDTQHCKLGGQGLKNFCAPFANKFTYKKRLGGKIGMWGRGLAQNTYIVVYKKYLRALLFPIVSLKCLF